MELSLAYNSEWFLTELFGLQSSTFQPGYIVLN